VHARFPKDPAGRLVEARDVFLGNRNNAAVHCADRKEPRFPSATARP
jgi:hypothetical protein